VLQVQTAGQKTSFAEQGTPLGTQDKKRDCVISRSKVRLCRKITEPSFTYAGRRYERL